MLRVLALILFCNSGLAFAEEISGRGRPASEVEIQGPVTRLNIELSGAKDNVKLGRLADGSPVYVVKRLGAGTDRVLTPAEFTEVLMAQRKGGGWMETILNISSPAGIVWVALGLGGQLLFTGRMLVQWLVSEKSRRSVVPVSFWWMSLIGSSMLLVYFIWRRDIVGIIGQGTGWIIYIRNLVLIRGSRA
ncbi:MAG: hypothetical protein Fur0032_16810 [Terrimicrobiaceae bacterium]